jgi:glycosyltransferase involved in cell wall biosynthesis
MNSIKISAVIITFNEENNISRCLQSLQSVVDEIIVIDSYSTDLTEKICHDYNVKFVKKRWEGYSQAKNHGNSLAQHTFILSLDADEALSEELQNSIIEIKRTNKYQAYYVRRLTNYCGRWIKHCGWYPDYKLRLWDKNLAQWDGIVHESLIFTQKVPSGTLYGNLLHYSFYTISDHIKKANMFSEVAAKEILKADKKVNLVYHIILKPCYTFIHKYFFQLGFLDGFYGLVICTISAFSNFLKYSKARDLFSK